MRKAVSILNEVIGPLMRGPSSSHTAGPYHLGALLRSALGEIPRQAIISFDPGGSFAEVFSEQGSDRGFAAGLLGISMLDEDFSRALELAPPAGLDLEFRITALKEASHPNTVRLDLMGADGARVEASGASIGGGAVEITVFNGWEVHLAGEAYELLVHYDPSLAPAISAWLEKLDLLEAPAGRSSSAGMLLHARCGSPLDPQQLGWLAEQTAVLGWWTVDPVFFVPRGPVLARSALEMERLALAEGWSLGRLGLAQEASLLQLAERRIEAEFLQRYHVMKSAVEDGLSPMVPPMRLLQENARQVFQAASARSLSLGGPHLKAAARAMAVMRVNATHGLVCAAPTAGSAGVIPAVLTTLGEELNLTSAQLARCLMAAGAVGWVIAQRATFAAEVAGCQVEIGASGAMAAAAVVEAVGGSAAQALDAASIALQNTAGLICDPVQGLVEIPCATRNAAAASNAFLCADLILGGYQNPIGLDETIDAIYAAGKLLPRELKCTALGGLSLAPSGKQIKPVWNDRPPSR